MSIGTTALSPRAVQAVWSEGNESRRSGYGDDSLPFEGAADGSFVTSDDTVPIEVVPAPVFEGWPKIPRAKASRITITEKIDGTNAQIYITAEGAMHIGSRNRWLEPTALGGKQADNYGFAAWCAEHRDELATLGPGRHFGEWYGEGINTGKGTADGYGLTERRLALFNVYRPADQLPACVEQVPILYQGAALESEIGIAMASLHECGSMAAPGWMKPEGVIVYSHALKSRMKVKFDQKGGWR